MNRVISGLFIVLFGCAVTHFSNAADASSSAGDTTISAQLEKNKPSQTISGSFNDTTMAFTLKIGSESVSGVFIEAYNINLEVIQIDKDDNYFLLVIEGIGPEGDDDSFFYEFINGKIVPCGNITYANNFRSKGDKILEADRWMGFWSMTENYYFDSNSRTLVEKPKEFYNVNVDAKVIAKFRLLKNRDDKSESAGSLKPGAKITLIKADITPKCKDAEGNDDNAQCYWYYIKASDGTEGWSRLRDFQQNVDGLPWAG